MIIGPYVQRVMSGASWAGDGGFPWRQGTADDCERLFAWADRLGQFDRFLSRLQARPKERDATIAEIRAAWFLESLGFQLVSWEPAVTNRPGEFEVRWPGTPSIFVEVKQPTWESELTEDEKRGPRKRLPRYIAGDGQRGGDTQVQVRCAAENTLGKLSADRPNLLVVVDRLFHSPVKDLEAGDVAAMLADPKFIALGGILCIDANWLKDDGTDVAYGTLFEGNPRAAGTAWEIPAPAAQALDAATKAAMASLALRTRPLAEIATVRGGLHLRPGDTPGAEGEHSILQARDLAAVGRPAWPRLARFDFDGDAARYAVRNDDILVPLRGSKLRAVRIEHPPVGVLAAGHVAILSALHEVADAAYLAWYLNLDSTQARLKQLCKGSGMPFLPMQDFRAFPVALPGLDVQRRIAHLGDLARRERALLAQLAELREALVNGQIRTAAQVR